MSYQQTFPGCTLAFSVLAGLGTVYYAVRRGRQLLGGEGALKSATKKRLDSTSD